MIIVAAGLVICFIIVLVLAETAPLYEELEDGSFKLIEKETKKKPKKEFFQENKSPFLKKATSYYFQKDIAS